MLVVREMEKGNERVARFEEGYAMEGNRLNSSGPKREEMCSAVQYNRQYIREVKDSASD